jgi:hypothetical protein
MSSVACPALQYLSKLSHKRHDFRKKVIEYKIVNRVYLQHLYEIFVIPRRIESDMIKMYVYIRLHVKYPLFLSD